MLLCLPAFPAAAAFTDAGDFADDVESGQLLQGDGGQWTTLISRPGVTLSVSPASAHRGQYGIQVNDQDPTVSGLTEATLTASGAPPALADYYVRTWIRVTPMGGSANANMVPLVVAVGGYAILMVYANVSAPTSLSLAGYSQAQIGADFTADGPFAFSDGQWHLWEARVQGLGTTTGSRSLWTDGSLATTISGIDWSGRAVDAIKVGETWCDDASFVGTVDFDDVRGSGAPMATFLDVGSDAGSAAAGACVPFFVSLRSSVSQAAAPAPYPLTATVSAIGTAGGVYSDPSCTAATSSILIPVGQAQVQGFFSPAARGTVTVTARQIDFLSGSGWTLQVAGDGGSADGGSADGGTTGDGGAVRPPRVDTVGCGCSQAGATPLVLLWLFSCLPMRSNRLRERECS